MERFLLVSVAALIVSAVTGCAAAELTADEAEVLCSTEAQTEMRHHDPAGWPVGAIVDEYDHVAFTTEPGANRGAWKVSGRTHVTFASGEDALGVHWVCSAIRVSGEDRATLTAVG